MNKSIVFYYSHSGNNRFLAKKTAETINCDIEEIKPRLSSHVLMIMGLNFGIRKIKADLAKYDRIILCGPIMVGKFLPPLRNFVLKHKSQIQKLIFITCCGSSYEMRDQKFGHGLVFKQIEEILGNKCSICEAFPITLVMPLEKREDPKFVMATRLNNDNFAGEILDRFHSFIEKITA